MKHLILILASVFMFSVAQAQTSADVAKTDDWVWFGIDYTSCYFLTKMDFPSVSDLESKLDAWNNLVLVEREKFIDKTLKGKDITYYIEMVGDLNDEVDVKSRLTNDGFMSTHLEADMIQGMVDNYSIPEELSGIGLILIAESYSKPNTQGAYFVTFFDIDSKKVLVTERMLGKSRGFGLRNYWANTYYMVLQQIGKKYK